MGRVPTTEEVERRKLFSPAKAKEELHLSLLHRSSHFLAVGKLHGKKSLRVSFKELKEAEQPDVERQALVLKSLIFLMHLPQMPVSIALQHCAVLNTNTLGSFLHKDLEYLDLRYCSQIKNSDLGLIQNRCPKLKELHLTGCARLTAVIEEGDFSNNPLTFSSLKVLSIDRCPNLKRIDLRSPCLRKVNGE